MTQKPPYPLTNKRRVLIEEAIKGIYPTERDQSILLRSIMEAIDYKDASSMKSLVKWAGNLSHKESKEQPHARALYDVLSTIKRERFGA